MLFIRAPPKIIWR